MVFPSNSHGVVWECMWAELWGGLNSPGCSEEFPSEKSCVICSKMSTIMKTEFNEGICILSHVMDCILT